MVRYPRTSILLFTAVAAVATLSIASRSSIDPRNTSLSTPRPTHSPLDDIYLPFDTLRTDPANYIWPTDASVLLTSGFGEFRSTHFHAGIDISTNNRTGYKVFASRDGFVSRVRVSPYGYGKMLSVRHADGYSTIYAHLQRFNDEIEDSMRQSQLRNQRYALDMEMEKDVFPVRKGEVIAYSGDTGVGSAHLHFEIQDERLHPVNPFLFPAFVDAVEDRTPPVFEALALTPLDYTSLVEGLHVSHIAEARRISAREYRFASPLRLTGDIGVAVKAYDKANHPYYRNSIRRYRVLLDSLHVFTMNLDRFPADESKQIALFYDWSLLVERRGRFQKLYIDEGNRLPLYERLPHGSGVLRTLEHGEGSYELTIEATDAQGNTARLHGTVVLNHPPEIKVRREEKKLLVSHNGGSAIAAVHVAKRNEEGGWTRQRFPLVNLSRDQESFEVPIAVGARDVFFVEAENAFGTRSAPVFIVPPTTTSKAPSLLLQHQRVRDFLIVTASAPAPLTSTPILYAASGASSFTAAMHQRDLTTATASVPLAVVDERDVELSVEATVGSFPVHAKELIRVVAITPERGGRIESDDGLFSAEFPPNAVYATLLLAGKDRTRVRPLPTRCALKSRRDDYRASGRWQPGFVARPVHLRRRLAAVCCTVG